MNPDQACFIEFITSGSVNPKVKLVNKRTIIGRHGSCTIRIGENNLHVSNKHAAIIIEGTDIFIEDLQSTNGIFVNGKRVMKSSLKHSDVIRFGTNGPNLKFIIGTLESETYETSSPKIVQSIKNKSGTSDDYPQNIHSKHSDNEHLFDVSPDSESEEYSNPDNWNKPVQRSFTGKQPELKLFSAPDKSNGLLDVSPTSEPIKRLKINESNRIPVPQAYRKNSEYDPFSRSPGIAPEANSLLDLSPDVEIDDQRPSNCENVIDNKNISSESRENLLSDDKLFDISPGTDSVIISTPIQDVNSTVEITKRLQNNQMNTQDIGILVKDEKKRLRVLSNTRLNEHQKHLITTVTNAYRSMKRTHLIIFGLISILLFSGTLWFAFNYFSYKKKFPKALDLKKKIEKYDSLLETARTLDETDNSEINKLYKQLQFVQSQFDSVKARLEVKDQRKIYSDTVEFFLSQIMEELNQTNYSIPQHMLERVKYYIGIFTNGHRRSTEKLMKRKTVYFTTITSIFRDKNIPTILAYVAMQESLLDPSARSSAGAVGMWQFMKDTGLRFNLTIRDNIDERLDWKKATYAAADYFRSLILQFGDGRGTLLAIAAYNAGEQKIKNALQDVEDPVRDRDFWYLYRTSTILAMETREYVPQIFARIIIDRHPDLYGFKDTTN